MSVVYIKEQGSYIRKKGNRIEVTKGTGSLLEYPILYMDTLVLLGNVQISTQALHILLQEGIDIIYMTQNGKYIGHTVSENSRNIFLRLAQFQMYEDIEQRLLIAKKIVENKISNQIKLIQIHRWQSQDTEWKESIVQMKQHKNLIDEANSSQELMGIEGICSNIYFRCFSRMLKGDFQFTTRNRRPPKDPVNAILSLTYTFLTHELESLLEGNSFEPCLGFLHGIRYGRKSLALDLVEEFRQPVADRFVLQLFSKRMLDGYDFEEGEAVLLNESGFRKFCTAYEKWMTKPMDSNSKNFRALMKRQVGLLKQMFQDGVEYQPFALKDE